MVNTDNRNRYFPSNKYVPPNLGPSLRKILLLSIAPSGLLATYQGTKQVQQTSCHCLVSDVGRAQECLRSGIGVACKNKLRDEQKNM